MSSQAQWPQRRTIRLRGYNYAWPGAYFVTMSTYQGALLFGDIHEGDMRLNALGQIVREELSRTRQVRNAEVSTFVVMPNHVHAIVVITTASSLSSDVPDQKGPPRGPAPNSTGAIVGQLKSVTTRRVNHLRGAPDPPVWHRNYYERVIRNEQGWERVAHYILNNPARWEADGDNPTRSQPIDPPPWEPR